MKNIIITGGTGFIGQYLLQELSKNNCNITVLTSRNSTNVFYQADNIHYKYCSNSLQDLITCLKDGTDVVHLAGMIPSASRNELAFSDTCLDYIRYSRDLFEACEINRISTMVYGSSIAVYGNQGNIAYSESQVCEPNSMYGFTKLSVEKLAGYYHGRNHINVKSLRFSQVFGARKKIVRPFLKMCIDNCLKKEALTIFGTGKTTQDYIYVKDVVNSILLALNKDNLHGPFNIGIGRQVSTMELAEAHCAGFKNPSGIVIRENEKEKMFTRSLDISKAKDVLGYSPQYTLTEACEDMNRLYIHKEYIPD